MRKNILYFICLFIILIYVYIEYIVINYKDIKKRYYKLRSKKYYACISILEHSIEKCFLLNYKYLDLIDDTEKSKNMFLKSKISLKTNFENKTKEEILKKLTKLCSYAKEHNIFIWLSAVYETTLDDEYYYYNEISKNFNNIGITLSCSHSSISKKIDKILQNNGTIRLVKGLYKGDISNDFKINQLYLENAKKLCNSNNYQCLATHDFNILNKLNLNKNKNLELSFYFNNLNYVEYELKKNNICVENISFYIAYGNKIYSLFDKKMKLPYYHKKKILFNPFHKLLY